MKNKFLRTAAMLLVLTLVTTCMVGGTFAKYITSDTAQDSARVAKWGVEVKAWDNSLFTQTYATNGTVNNKDGEAIANSVDVNTNNKGVAPGTANTEDTTFSITGTPEVAVNIAIAMEVTNDVIVPAANDTYLDWTTGADANDKFNLDTAYTPVVFTLKNSNKTENNGVVATGTLAQIETYLEGLSANFAPNTNLSTVFGTYTLSWEWVINGNDKADTLLGMVAAGQDTSTGVVDDINYNISITVTQVD